MDNEKNNALQEYLDLLKEKIENLAAAEKAGAEAMREAILSMMPQAVESLAGAIAEIAGIIRAAIIIERSRDANRRRRETRAAKPRPPIKKRMRVYRCRNNC